MPNGFSWFRIVKNFFMTLLKPQVQYYVCTGYTIPCKSRMQHKISYLLSKVATISLNSANGLRNECVSEQGTEGDIST
jgi:hypothetical protein